MADNEQRLIFTTEVDKRSQDRTLRAIEDLKARIGGIGKVVGESAATFETRFERALNRVARSRAIEQITNDFVEAFKASGDLESALVGIQAQLRAIGATDSELAQVANQLDRIGQGNQRRGGSGAGGASSLSDPTTRAIGTSIRNLPSVGIPGTPFSTEQISKVVLSLDRLGVSIGQLGIAGVAVVGALVAVKVAFDKFVGDAIASANRLTEQFLSGVERTYDLIARGGTTEAAQERLEELAVAMRATADEAALYDAILAENVQQIDELSRANQGLAELFDAVKDTPLDQLRDSAQAARDEFDNLSSETNALQNAIIDGAFAANDAAAAADNLAEAERRLADERARFADVLAGTQIDAIKASAGRTAEQVRARLAEIENIVRVNDEFLASGTLSADVTKRLTEENTRLNVEYQTLLQSVIDVKEAEEAQAAAANRLASSLDVLSAANSDLARIEAETLEKREALLKKYNDSAIKIAEAAADAADKALDNLQRKLADLDVDFQRGEAQAARKAQFDAYQDAVKFQEREAKDLRDHLQRLKQIRDSSADDEFQAQLDRNFAALFDIRRKRERDIASENERAQAEATDRQRAFEALKADTRAVLDFERNERRIRLAEQQADAQAAYQAELQLIENQRIEKLNTLRQQQYDELTELKRGSVNAINERRNQMAEELKALSEGGQAIISLQRDILLAQLKQMGSAYQAIIGLSAAKPASRAFGGSLSRGQLSLVNERGFQEAFNGALLPPGKGLFLPLESGTVNANPRAGATNNLSLSVAFNVPNSIMTPAEIWQYVKPRLAGEVERVMVRVTA